MLKICVYPNFFRLNAYYECVPGSVAVKNEVYAEYLATCSRYAIKNALNSTGFSDCIKWVLIFSS